MTEKYIPKDLDLSNMGGLLVVMLMSRAQPNIEQRDLAYIEESGDLNDFKGFFRDTNVKQLFVRITMVMIDLIGHDDEALHFVH